MTEKHEIPERDQVEENDRWDLASLFSNREEWAKGLDKLDKLAPEIEKFRGTLHESASRLAECLRFMNEAEILEERVAYYAFLKKAEDAGDSSNQAMHGKYMSVATKIASISSFIRPEIQEIPEEKINAFLSEDCLKEFEISIRKLIRFKPHILSEKEEKLLAMQTEAHQTANKTFHALNDVDMEFGIIETPEGKKPLSQSTFSSFMLNPDREIRKDAYRQFYNVFENHKNTLSSLYAGSIHLDICTARIRNYDSARAMALFPDKVPADVYDNLIQTVGEMLPALHEYYALRKKVLGVEELRHYDVYVPLVKDVKVHHTYDQAVEIVMKALQPMGKDYCNILKAGLAGRWVDRYENKGKQSGAFSAGSYTGDPYILMNFKADVLRDVFTLAHEAGHSMHSYYSSGNNPFQHYNYSIFEAEVASTFNEQLLAELLLERAEDDRMKAYITGKLADDIIATIYRQTMFAEFEDICHRESENGNPLTVEFFRSSYRNLLEKYFGPEMVLDDVSDMEGLRIPHFYRAFYVYKYATGLSAAIALSRRVLKGGERERADYLNFLKSGGSRYPLESLALAGVDMSSPEPVRDSLRKFADMVKQLRALLI